jgi:hypothetical protein
LGKDIEDIVEQDKEASYDVNDAIQNNPHLEAYFESMQKQEEQEAQLQSNLTNEEREEERQANERMGR